MKNTTKTKAEVSPLFRNQKGVEYKTGILTVTDGVSEMHFAFHAPYSFEEEAYKIITGYLDGWDSCYEAMVSKLMQCFDLATRDDLNDCFTYVYYDVKKDNVHCVEKDINGEQCNEYLDKRHKVVEVLANKTLSIFSGFLTQAILEDRLGDTDDIQDAMRLVHKRKNFYRI
jgi:hypothetical protein